MLSFVAEINRLSSGTDCVKRNVSDLRIQLMSVQGEQPPSRNQIGRQLQNIMAKMQEIITDINGMLSELTS